MKPFILFLQRVVLIFPVILIFMLQGCSSLSIKIEPTLKHDGHFSTTEKISEFALIEKTRADALSCFTQAPDAIKKYNAVNVFFSGIFELRYRNQIFNALHSLHGGDHSAVIERRKILEDLVRESYLEHRPDWQTGFLIHALGDSYAHVHGPYESAKSYNQFIGHGLALPWDDPDEIYTPQNYRKYVDYVRALYRALTGSITYNTNENLEHFVKQVQNTALSDFPRLMMNRDLPNNWVGTEKRDCEAMYDRDIRDQEVREFLEKLETRLEHHR